MPLPRMPMPHEVSIQRLSYDGMTEFGGETTALQMVATELKCFVQNASSVEIERFRKRQMSVSTKMYFTSEPPLREGDEVTVTRNDKGTSYIGQRFEFKAIDDATAGFGILWKAFFDRKSNPVEPVV